MKKITVAEYHKETGLSKKTIYKKIDQGKLKTETQYINNRPITFIVLEGQDFTPDLPPSPEGNLPPSPDSTLDFLMKQLIEKDRQLAEKDKQINSLLEQITQAQNLLDQEQRLHAGTRALLKEPEEPEEQERKEPKKQRSKLYKFFFEV